MFHPTYLYVKQHSITKKCYFGKTTKIDPIKYLGSGKYWRRHIKKYGVEFVETLWFKLFTDEHECTSIALLFSEQQDIVSSKVWLNMIPENGMGGSPNGVKHSQASRNKMSLAAEGNKKRLGINHSQESKDKMSVSKIGNKHLLGFRHSTESRKKMSKPKSVEHKLKIAAGVRISKSIKNQRVVD